jgi:hypothetical protein
MQELRVSSGGVFQLWLEMADGQDVLDFQIDGVFGASVTLCETVPEQ